MTAVFALINRDCATVYADTLRTDQQGRPHSFCSKLHWVSPCSLAVVGIGRSQLSSYWVDHLGGWIGADLDDIDRLTPARLRWLWRQVKNRLPEDTARIVHLGFVRREGRQELRATEYDSANGFLSRSMPFQGLSVLAYPPVNPMRHFESPDEQAIWGIHQQRQQFREQGQQHAVGGHIEKLQIRPDTATISVIHRFDDYEQSERVIRERLAREEQKRARQPAWLRRWLIEQGIQY